MTHHDRARLAGRVVDARATWGLRGLSGAAILVGPGACDATDAPLLPPA